MGNCIFESHSRGGTYRSKRLPACGSAPKDDVRVVVFENAEKTLKSGLVTETAG